MLLKINLKLDMKTFTINKLQKFKLECVLYKMTVWMLLFSSRKKTMLIISKMLESDKINYNDFFPAIFM